MRARQLIIAAAGLALAAAGAAEPAKAPVRKADHSADKPVELVVAAADQASAPAPAGQAETAPPKRERRARVTTCRCGDPNAEN